MTTDDTRPPAVEEARQTLREQIAYILDPPYWTPGQYTAEVDEFIDQLVAATIDAERARHAALVAAAEAVVDALLGDYAVVDGQMGYAEWNRRVARLRAALASEEARNG